MRLLFCLIAAMDFVYVGHELSAKTTVALTTTVSTKSTTEERQLAANMLEQIVGSRHFRKQYEDWRMLVAKTPCWGSKVENAQYI